MLVGQMSNVWNIAMDDGGVYALAKTLPSLAYNLWWNIVMDDCLDENTIGKWR